MTIRLTRELISGLKPSGPTDPIHFYRRPIVGWLYRQRINIGFQLLPERRFGKALEVGFGAGAVQLSLSDSVDDLHGIDLDADAAAVTKLLDARGRCGTLVRGSVCELPYPDSTFDLVVCFSVFEHLHEYEKGLREVARVLKNDGLFLLGMPAVNRSMEVAFRLIGFKGIEDFHITTPRAVAHRFATTGLRVKRARKLGPGLYYNWLLEKVR